MLFVLNSVALPRDAAAPSDPAASSTPPASVVITESQVMFATTAARIPAPDGAARRYRVAALWKWLSARDGAEPQTRRPCPPRRPAYIERAAMARAMERL